MKRLIFNTLAAFATLMGIEVPAHAWTCVTQITWVSTDVGTGSPNMYFGTQLGVSGQISQSDAAAKQLMASVNNALLTQQQVQLDFAASTNVCSTGLRTDLTAARVLR